MASSSNSNSNSEWASLPAYLLDSILDNLVPMEDYLAFSEVCDQWRQAVCEKLEDLRSNHKRHCRLHQQVPLLLAPSPDDTRKDRFCLFDVIKGRSVWEFDLRAGRYRFEGSSHGWLILFDIESFKVILFNPVSGKSIDLPPLRESTFSLIWNGPDDVRKMIIPPNRWRCVLSMDPGHVSRRGDEEEEEEVVFMVTCKAFEQKIAFIKLGDEDWSYVDQLGKFEDIACINGFFYMVDKWGAPYSAHAIHSNNSCKLRWIHSPTDRRSEFENENEQYLVESPEGDLLRVEKNNKTGLLLLFKMYRLIWLTRKPRWEEVMNLGDVALFLGNNHSVSVRASDFPGCVPNSIYFCGPSTFSNALDGPLYVFSITDRTMKQLHCHSRRFPLWISSSPSFSQGVMNIF